MRILRISLGGEYLEMITTGCVELDYLLGGGVPKGTALLISGPAGTYKSSLAYSILLHNVKQNKTGIHFLLEQSKEKFVEQLRSMALDTHLDKAEVVSYSSMIGSTADVQLRIPDMDQVQDTIIQMLSDIRKEIRKGCDVVVFDSLTALMDLGLQHSDSPWERGWLRDLLGDLHLTDGLSIIISEWRPDLAEGPEKYLVDGVLRTYRHHYGQNLFVEVVCEKMRCVDVQREFRILKFEKKSFKLEPVPFMDLTPEVATDVREG